MTKDALDVIRTAYEAYARGDLDVMLSLVDPDLEWTFLDPSMADPAPETCHGRHELAEVMARRAELGLASEVQDMTANGDHVMVVARTPGADARRARPTGDMSFTVFTVRDGRIVAMRDCRDREEAVAIVGAEAAPG